MGPSMDTPTEPRRGPVTIWFATALWKRILLAVLLGGIVGYFWGEGATRSNGWATCSCV